MSTPTAFVPGPIVMPALSMTLADACSILTGLKTFHFPSGNLWNDAQGALPVWAIADDIPNAIAQATTIEWTGCLIMAALRRQRSYATGRLKKPQGPGLRTAVTLVGLRARPPDSAMRHQHAINARQLSHFTLYRALPPSSAPSLGCQINWPGLAASLTCKKRPNGRILSRRSLLEWAKDRFQQE